MSLGLEPSETRKPSGFAETRGIILTITLVAGVLLILNVILISCYVRRKAERKRLNGKFPFSIFQIPFYICRPPNPPAHPLQPRPIPHWTW